MKVFPVTKIMIDEASLRAAYNQATGKTLGSRISNQDPILHSLNVVADFAGLDLCENNGKLLRHGFASFVCVLTLDAILEIQESSRLAITYVTTKSVGFFLCLISGNLQDWRNVIIDGCSPHASLHFHSFAELIYKACKSAGLGPVWSDCNVQTTQNTVMVVRK